MENININNINLFEVYNQLANYNFTIESGLCKFDMDKLDIFYSQISNPEILQITKKIIQTTYYATFNDIISKLNIAFDQFSKKISNNPFVIITEDFPKKRISSQSLMIYLLWEKIKKLNVQGIYNIEETYDKNHKSIHVNFPEYDALVIDDAIYTGGQLSCTIRQWERFKLSNQCHIITAYANKDPIFGDDFNKCTKYIGLELDDVKDDNLIENYLWTSGRIPLYLDYKVASPQSTYYYLYNTAYVPQNYIPRAGWFDANIVEKKQPKFGSLMKQTPNRQIIYDLEKVINQIFTQYNSTV